MTEDARLDGKVAIVTGASAGIGRATAVALARVGASVVVTARREDRLAELAAEIEDSGGKALPLRCDVSEGDDVLMVVAKTLDVLGSVDILVNNAGTMSIAPLSKGRLEDWTRMVDVNINGVLRFVSAVLPTMLEQGSGHVVSVGSLAGRRPFPGGGVYAATKFAVRALSWAMHLELGAEHGIRIPGHQSSRDKFSAGGPFRPPGRPGTFPRAGLSTPTCLSTLSRMPPLPCATNSAGANIVTPVPCEGVAAFIESYWARSGPTKFPRTWFSKKESLVDGDPRVF